MSRLEQGSAAVCGCSAESDGRGPAIRYALPLRPPERSRGITGRPAPCPFDAGAAHLAAAAPKRARRPGALHAGSLEVSAKRLRLRGITPNCGPPGFREIQPDLLHRIPAAPPAGDAGKTTPPSSPHHRSTLGDLRRQGSMP